MGKSEAPRGGICDRHDHFGDFLVDNQVGPDLRLAMRVLIAPQEFKGTLTALEATEAIAAGLREQVPSWEIDALPMADGGPGSGDVLAAAGGGERQRSRVNDPLLREVEAEWIVLKTGAAVIECAAASGLWRLAEAELDPRRASSYGTGQLIAAALERGCRSILVGLGGSATNDAGAGLAQALGFQLLDRGGRNLPPGGAALIDLGHIDTAGKNPVIVASRISAAIDVTNPLCGPQGATAMFGPQKGADEAAVAELDAALDHFADIIGRDLGTEVRDVAGAGAAGGLGAGLIAFLGAELKPGAALIGEAVGLEERVRAADLILTGEGRLDGQTAFGKTTLHVAQLGRSAGKPVVCLTGSLGPGSEKVTGEFAAVESLSDFSEGTPLREEAAEKLARAAGKVVSSFEFRGGFFIPG